MIAPPEIENTVYVDGLNGSDDNDGSSEEAAFRSLKHEYLGYVIINGCKQCEWMWYFNNTKK